MLILGLKGFILLRDLLEMQVREESLNSQAQLVR